jgi:hypothetical protein
MSNDHFITYILLLIRIKIKKKLNWAELDSNQRSITQRIYNPPPLTTRTPTPFNYNFNILKTKKQY